MAKASLAHRIVSALVIIAIAGAAGWYFYQRRRVQQVGIVSENVVHDGSLWKADFVARIPAPEPQVYGAIEHIENAHSGNIKRVRILDRRGNTKTVEMEVAGPAGQTITTKVAFEYFPAENRIAYRTIDSPALDTRAEYKLEDDGADTIIRYHETTKLLQSYPVPDAVVKRIISGLFVSQISGLRRALHVTSGDDSADAGEP